LSFPLATEINGDNLAILSVGTGNYLYFESLSDHLTSTQDLWATESCADAHPFAVSDSTIGVTTLLPRLSGHATWYLRASFASPRQATLPPPLDPALANLLEVCSDCAETLCSALGTSPTTLSGEVILKFTTGVA